MAQSRKRSASTFSASDSDGQTVAKSASAKLLPFESGAELHQALKTPSADLLRLLLSRFRAQTSLDYAQNQERSLIPASDRRIEMVRDYCQLCMTDASNSSGASSAANTIFSAWDLADKQNLPTLLHLPIFSLAHALALLSVHYPTQTLGEAIIERLLSPNEPWFARLQTYISHLGGPKLASSKPSDAGRKGSDVTALAALILLREINTFARGKYAGKVFDSFNWGMKVLPHIFSMRRRSHHNRKKARTTETKAPADASLRRPDIRTLYVLFLLSFLEQTYSSSLKVRLLDLGRDFVPALLKGLAQDPADVVQIVLVHLHEHLIKDDKISRSKKIELLNEWACECIVKLYDRDEDHVSVHADAQVGDNPSVAELAHHFLLSICTNPGFGICYPDRGWYPRKNESDNSLDEISIIDSALGSDETAVVSGSNAKASQSGSIHNKVLSGVIRQLAVTSDLRQQELALMILQACPELVGPYLESSCAGLSVEPKASSRWLCNMALFERVVTLDLPSFRGTKVERLLDATNDAQSNAPYSSDPPPMRVILSNLLPGPLHRFLFSQGLSSSDRLVQYTTCVLLSACLRRVAHFRAICEEAILQLDEDVEGPWRKRLQAVEIEARKRLPDISVVIQILQLATGQTSRAGSRTRASTVDTEDNVSVQELDTAPNLLLTEVALRVLWLYYLGVPSTSHDVRFNAGKLLSSSFMLPAQIAKTSSLDESENSDSLNLTALCQVHTLRILSLSSDTVFDWTAKASSSSGTALSYLGLLLCLLVSTPLPQIREACESVLRKILSSSVLFEHNPAEIDAWVYSLPYADHLQSSNAETRRDLASAAITHVLASPDQMHVIAFIDECALRCMKTPYRYIEASRQYVADEYKSSRTKYHESSSDLVLSPLLMVLLEQFLIRARKALIGSDAMDALLAFFARLLPCLSSYALDFQVLLKVAEDIRDSLMNPPTPRSSDFLADVVFSRISVLASAASPDSSGQMKPASKRAVHDWEGLVTPSDVRRKLRESSRPISRHACAKLCATVQQMSSAGFDSILEILDELDPISENISHLLNFDQSVQTTSTAILHLTRDTVSDSIDGQHSALTAASSDADLLPDSTSRRVVNRLAIWVALNRMCNAADSSLSALALTQSKSILDLVLRSEDSMETLRYLFVEATPRVFSTLGKLFSDSTGSLAVFFVRICECSATLDPSQGTHRQMLEPLISLLAVSAGWLWTRNPPLAAIRLLAPFMDIESASAVCDRLLASLQRRPTPDTLDSLRLLLTSFPGSRALSTKLARHTKDFLAVGEADDSVVGMLHDLMTRERESGRISMQHLIGRGVHTLLSFDVRNYRRDGLILELMQRNAKVTHTVSAAIAKYFGESADMAETLLHELPFSICAVLEAQEQQKNAHVVWTEAGLQSLVHAAVVKLVSNNDEHIDGAFAKHLPLVTGISHAVKLAERKGWLEVGRSLVAEVLGHLSTCTPRVVFSESMLHLVHVLYTSEHQLAQLDTIGQKIIDQALLWLVRRFAEDENDSMTLVRCINILTKLLRVSSLRKIVLLRQDLVDPVVQAGIKNRLLASSQLELIVELCATSDLSSTQLSRYLGAITAHADFSAIMRESASVMSPPEAPTDTVKAGSSRPLRSLVVRLIYTIATRGGKALLQPTLMAKLMSFYSATLHPADRQLLDLFRMSEEQCAQPFMLLASQWSLPSSRFGGTSSAASLLDALLSLDANIVFATCTEYPRCLPLKRSTISGYIKREIVSLPGQVHGKHADLAQRYDPVFLGSLLAGLISTQKLTGLQWLSVLATNVPGLVMCGLSSQHADMRQVSFDLLQRCYTSAQESNFQEKEHLLMVFDLLKDAVLADIQGDVDESDGLVTPVLPMSTTLFVAHSLRSLASPSSFVYPAISHFMLQRPELDVGDVPMLYSFLYSATDCYRQERVWLLRFLRDVSRSGGRSDWKVLKRRHTWRLLESLYDSSTTSLDGGVSAERATEEAAVRALIEDTIFWLAQHPDIATELVTRRNILSWIWQQLVREGVVSSHASEALPMRDTWLLLVAQLVSHADLDRLDKAAGSTWRASVAAIVSSTLRAIERRASHVAAHASEKFSTSIVYAAALIMEKTIWSQQLRSDELSAAAQRTTSLAGEQLLRPAAIESVASLLQLSKQWLAAVEADNAETQALQDARRCCKRVQNCILGLAASPSSDEGQTRHLARLLRESVQVCKAFDRETQTLLLTTILAP